MWIRWHPAKLKQQPQTTRPALSKKGMPLLGQHHRASPARTDTVRLLDAMVMQNAVNLSTSSVVAHAVVEGEWCRAGIPEEQPTAQGYRVAAQNTACPVKPPLRSIHQTHQLFATQAQQVCFARVQHSMLLSRQAAVCGRDAACWAVHVAHEPQLQPDIFGS